MHITTGPLFMLTWPLFSGSAAAPFLAAVVPALNGVRLLAIGSGLIVDEKAVRSISREGDPAELLRGPLYYVITMCVATALFWRGSPVGLAALSLMCGGDGLADVVRLSRVESLGGPLVDPPGQQCCPPLSCWPLNFLLAQVGRRWGANNRLPFNPAKSVAGSAAMVAGGAGLLVFFLSVFSALGYLSVDPRTHLPAILAVAAVAAAVESLPLAGTGLDDNLTVPLATMAAAYLLLPH